MEGLSDHLVQHLASNVLEQYAKINPASQLVMSREILRQHGKYDCYKMSDVSSR